MNICFAHLIGSFIGNVVLAGGLTMSLLILPIVIVASQETIRAVPMHLNEVSYGMGATKWQTVITIILPASLPGILTGSILALSRAVGETAPLVVIGIPALLIPFPGGVFDRFTVLPMQIYYWTLDSSLVAEYANLAAATIVVLLIVLLVLNGTAIYIRNKNIVIEEELKMSTFIKTTETEDALKHFLPVNQIIYDAKKLNLYYGDTHALKDISLSIYEKEVTAIIGPSGCGKSTFLKTLNRMVELVPDVRINGDIHFNGLSIFDKSYKVEDLRTRVGMVFQKPSPFPKSIYDNIAYGPKIHGIRNKKILDEIVETSLRKAFIWDEVKDRLNDNAYGLSGGQQQRLCIARCLAIEPEVILMDEPTSALDPKSTLKIEELIEELKREYSIIIVTHNMQQAARVSNKTAFFLDGEVVEYNNTNIIFNNPRDERTEDYIQGRFG